MPMDDPLSIFSILHSREPIADGGRFHCTVPADYPGFDGHFPGSPVVPGVCQIHWAVEVALAYSRAPRLHIGELAAVKFHNLLTPGTVFVVEVEWKNSGWRYRIYNAENSFASGKIVPR